MDHRHVLLLPELLPSNAEVVGAGPNDNQGKCHVESAFQLPILLFHFSLRHLFLFGSSEMLLLTTLLRVFFLLKLGSVVVLNPVGVVALVSLLAKLFKFFEVFHPNGLDLLLLSVGETLKFRLERLNQHIVVTDRLSALRCCLRPDVLTNEIFE